MASSLLLLLDDIASVLDDVATMTKVAAKKTAGVVGDDLALNAKQVTGVRADRELPVVWEVARGSALNKLILIPAALGISWVAPWSIPWLLIAGGSFLCYEGVEKILHKLLHAPAKEDARRAAHTAAVAGGEGQPVEVERSRINGAIRTDFILSAEIVVITDADATIQYVNPAFEKTTGYSREEVIGENPRILQSGQHNPDAFAMQHGQAFVFGSMMGRVNSDAITRPEHAAKLAFLKNLAQLRFRFRDFLVRI